MEPSTPTSTPTSPHLPPPEPGTAAPSGERAFSAGARPSRTPWRERLPEVVATVGASLVLLAVAGFLSSTWEELGQYPKAMILGLTAAGLTAAGLWARSRDLASVARDYVVGLSWAAATVCVAGSVTLAASTAFPGWGRLTVAAGGLAALAHALAMWAQDRRSLTQLAAAVAAGLYTAGPVGTSVHDRFDAGMAELLWSPLVGFMDPTLTTDAFLLTGLGHLVVGIALLAVGRQLEGRVRHAAHTTAGVLVGYAALELNVLPSQVGAVAALAVVLGFLVYGMVSESASLVVMGSVGALAAGVRVLAALFSGKALVTLLVFCGGVALLGWAFHAMRRRGEEESGTVPE
ncbi:MAG: hypothetical protein KY457_09500 [Actinobacteria bacterium]|nr:hypothetical protein [Actinomycetota bacterium]